MLQLVIALRYYATGCFQLVVADLTQVHKSTVCRAIHRVSRATASLRAQYVSLPDSNDERMQTMKEFYAIALFPGVLGTIDCTHVPISSPGGDLAEFTGWRPCRDLPEPQGLFFYQCSDCLKCKTDDYRHRCSLVGETGVGCNIRCKCVCVASENQLLVAEHVH